jgi:ubiquinone/menaquinone biosynthesis C-methylase UbiE
MPKSLQRYPNTYFVQDRSNDEELTRLQIQDQIITQGMGGVLPEQSDVTRFQRILDVGCGTGNWLRETAKTFPQMSVLMGVDVNRRMVEYARTQAAAQQISDRVQFHLRDALCDLEFPDRSFDLVNQRLGASWLRTWDWPPLLEKYRHVVQLGGVVRITECNDPQSTSPALTRLNDLFFDVLKQSGRLFYPERQGITRQLAHLLQQIGFKNVQTRVSKLEFRAGTPEGQHFYDDMKYLFRTILPFLRQWTHLPANYEAVYQQALSEMRQPDFVATWDLLTAWGTRNY